MDWKNLYPCARQLPFASPEPLSSLLRLDLCSQAADLWMMSKSSGFS